MEFVNGLFFALLQKLKLKKMDTQYFREYYSLRYYHFLKLNNKCFSAYWLHLLLLKEQ